MPTTRKKAAPAKPCLDDPGTILQQEMCLNALSKNGDGKLILRDSKLHKCHAPACQTLKTVHELQLFLHTNPPCDTPITKSFDGDLKVERLVTAFDRDGTHRGFHAGDFVLTGPAGLTVTGRLSGVTNLGTHRPPIFQACQQCNEHGVMEGRLCGQVIKTNDPALKDCQIIAAYRIRFDSSTTGGQGGIRAVIEGVLICPCKP